MGHRIAVAQRRTGSPQARHARCSFYKWPVPESVSVPQFSNRQPAE